VLESLLILGLKESMIPRGFFSILVPKMSHFLFILKDKILGGLKSLKMHEFCTRGSLALLRESEKITAN
jgi:hypothetical protein